MVIFFKKIENKNDQIFEGPGTDCPCGTHRSIATAPIYNWEVGCWLGRVADGLGPYVAIKKNVKVGQSLLCLGLQVVSTEQLWVFSGSVKIKIKRFKLKLNLKF